MPVTWLLCAVAVVAVPCPAPAQGRPVLADVSIGAAGDAGRAAISVRRQVLSAPLNARISLGLRASAYIAMTSRYQNRDVVQAQLVPTLDIDPGVFGANVAVGAELPLGPAALGADLDLLGVAAGARWQQGSLQGEPETASYFQYGPADHGALNSEFYLALRLSARLALRAGASHYVTNYIVTDAATAGRPSARYQRFETVPFVALRVRL